MALIKSLSNASLSLVECLTCLSAYDEASTPSPSATDAPLTNSYHSCTDSKGFYATPLDMLHSRSGSTPVYFREAFFSSGLLSDV
jgi:hypothetical protein